MELIVTQQIADWLNSIGLGEYAQRFIDNDIDVDVLSELTDQDLEKLGVSLGHRRKLLRAIRQLDHSALSIVQPATGSIHQVRPERRQLTVMFADLVDSTALGARLDPEDLREVIAAYQGCVTGLVAKVGGFIARYMGDGVLTYF